MRRTLRRVPHRTGVHFSRGLCVQAELRRSHLRLGRMRGNVRHLPGRVRLRRVGPLPVHPDVHGSHVWAGRMRRRVRHLRFSDALHRSVLPLRQRQHGHAGRLLLDRARARDLCEQLVARVPRTARWLGLQDLLEQLLRRLRGPVSQPICRYHLLLVRAARRRDSDEHDESCPLRRGRFGDATRHHGDGGGRWRPGLRPDQPRPIRYRHRSVSLIARGRFTGSSPATLIVR